MKYTIEGFNQQVLVDYGLNGTDAIILRYMEVLSMLLKKQPGS